MITEEKPVQILELFGGIGSPRCALRNLKIPTKAIDYVEIDEQAVRSYNNMFSEELPYKMQTVVGWNLRPDILIHGSPCQDMSIAGHQGKARAADGRINRGRGADKGSKTRSSLMWETIHIIEQMGEWKPKYVIWENVKNVTSKHMIANFVRYQKEMERLGYTNNYDVLDAREFGLPQARERVFTISCLNGEKFDFEKLIRTPMKNISDFLEDNNSVLKVYDVTQPSVYSAIGKTGIRRATVIKDFAYTITTRQRMHSIGVENVDNPYSNIRIGVDCMTELLKKYQNNYRKALTAYKYGPTGAERKYFSQQQYTCEYAETVLEKADRIKEELEQEH